LIGTGVFLGAFAQGSQGWKRLFKALGIIFSLYGSLLMIGSAAGQTNPLAPLSFMSASNGNSGVSSNHDQGAQHTRITTSQEFESLLVQANQDGKVLVLDFYADWCIACKVMDTEVFSQPEAGKAMANAVFVQLDMTDNTDNQLQFLKSFNLFGPPAVLFFKNQAELSSLRIVGDLPLTKFLATLESAKQH
jgi:thiol:disulfide interchange protein DsbD